MSKSSEAVKQWRKNTKLKVITCMGGCCQICKYSKCSEALELHHLDPNEKDFGLSAIMAKPVKWVKIVTEASKCILLCANCHREVHFNNLEIPKTFQKFDETLLGSFLEVKSFCPVCNKEKINKNKYCSLSCAGTTHGKVDWTTIDLIDLIENQKIAKTQIADMMGCSDQAVHKRYKKLKALAPSLGSTE